MITSMNGFNEAAVARVTAEADANSRLIADLLAALKELFAVVEAEFGWTRNHDGAPCAELCALSQCQDHGCVPMKLDAAKAAIARAEGR